MVTLIALEARFRTRDGYVVRGNELHVARERRGMPTTVHECCLLVHVVYQAIPPPPSRSVLADSTPSMTTRFIQREWESSSTTDSTLAGQSAHGAHIGAAPDVAVHIPVTASVEIDADTQSDATAVPATPNIPQPVEAVARGEHHLSGLITHMLIFPPSSSSPQPQPQL